MVKRHKPESARVVLITHPVHGAAAFARTLVEERLAACVNRIRLQSVYRWRGAIEEADEVLLLVKTSAVRLAALERALPRLHPSELPEFVALDPARVEARYRAWLLAETVPRRGRRA